MGRKGRKNGKFVDGEGERHLEERDFNGKCGFC